MFDTTFGADLPDASAFPNVIPNLGADPFRANDMFELRMADAESVAKSTTPPAPDQNSGASASSVKQDESGIKKDYLVTLTDMTDPSKNVVFYNMPEIGEQRSVDYEPISIVQGPGEFQKYKGTKSVQWSVNGVLTSRTPAEAKRNLEYINLLRGWSMPFFGGNTAKEYPGKLGAPPPVLELKGFRRDILGPIPVVLTNLNWTYPQDVDWIPIEGTNTPFPAVFRVSLTLVESYSTQQFNNFNLKSFYSGSMVNAWGLKAPGSAPPPPPPSETTTAEPTAAPQESQTVKVGTVKVASINDPSRQIDLKSAERMAELRAEAKRQKDEAEKYKRQAIEKAGQKAIEQYADRKGFQG